MAAPPIPRTFVPGEIETGAYLNSLSSVLNFLLNPPRCRLYASVAQTLPTGSYTPLTFNSEVYDTDTMHSTSSNTSRITCTTSGLYHVEAMATVTPNTTGRRLGSIFKNGAQLPTDTLDTEPVSSGSIGTTVFAQGDYQLAAGDYLEFNVYQDSGASLSTYATSNTVSWFSARWVASS
jgi:hypothetical protein